MALVFDAWLKLWSMLTNPIVLDAMDNIEAEVSTWPGATIGLHKYGGTQFNYNGRELGHIHGNGLLDLRFSRAVKAEILKDGRATHHYIFKKSGWVSFYILNIHDVKYATKLLRMNYNKRI